MSELGEKLKHAVRNIAAANPDFVYQEPAGKNSCAYVHDGCASCLLGQALWSLGLIDATLEREGPILIRDPNGMDIIEFLTYIGLDEELDGDEIIWLDTVQGRQDNGEPWGHCVGIS